MKPLDGLLICALAILLLIPAIYGWYRNRKMYRTIDRMLDEILNRQKISVSDLREGEISALASKMIRIQEKIEHEIVQAETEKEQVKSLISNMSHQLKTPLANVMMYQELLRETYNTKQQIAFLAKMKLQSDKIDWILRSLFKMVRLEQGSISFEVMPTPLRPALLNAINAVYEKAEAKNIDIITGSFQDCKLLFNEKWTTEVFVNILENAVKYSPRDTRLHIRVCPMELFTEVQFQDYGIGIKDSELPDIFKRFYRSKDVENKEGSGIGLYLSQLILEKEKGYMTVTSQYGTGSCFSVFLQNCQK